VSAKKESEVMEEVEERVEDRRRKDEPGEDQKDRDGDIVGEQQSEDR
jgi:hypothetical protein